MIQNLQTQVNSLQQKIIEFEKNQSLNSLSGTRMDEKTFFETPIGNFYLQAKEDWKCRSVSAEWTEWTV